MTDLAQQSVRAVTFDAFGTLIAFGAARTNPYQRLVTSTNGGAIARRPLLTRNVSVDAIAQELGLSQLMPTIRSELDAEIQGLQLFPEVAQVLRKLRVAGIPVAVCSNLAFEYGAAVRKLLPQLDAYVLSYEVGASKPEAEIYTHVCKMLTCLPEEVLFIGDSRRCDLDGPQAFGMQARLVDRANGQTLADVLEGVV